MFYVLGFKCLLKEKRLDQEKGQNQEQGQDQEQEPRLRGRRYYRPKNMWYNGGRATNGGDVVNDAKSIKALKDDLESKESGRNSAYDTILKHYGGSTYAERKKQGHWPKASATTLLPSHRDDEEVDANMRINFVRPAVLAKMAFMGLPSTIRVPPPPSEATGSEEASSLFADRQEKAYLGHWNFSRMNLRYRDSGWFQGAFGSSIWGVWPDIRHKRPRIFTRSPQGFYAIPYDEDGMELAKAMWVERMDGNTIFARWGALNKKLTRYEGVDDVEVIHYIDETIYGIVVDGNDFAFPPMENKTGEVTIVVVGNIGVPGSLYGDTDIDEGIEVAKEINYQITLLDEQARKTINPTIITKGKTPDSLAVGEGGVIELELDGSVEILKNPPIPAQHFQLVAQLQSWFDLITDNPAALRGEGFGSVLTGKGFNALLSPIASRLSQRRLSLDAGVSQVNRYLMHMWQKFPDFNQKTSLKGIRDKEYFDLDCEPEEFLVDGDMWTENEVFLSAQSFMDRQGTDVEIMQLRQQTPPLVSWDTAQEALPYVQDKARERKRIEGDYQWMQSLSQSMQPPQAGAPPDAEAQSYAMERGAETTGAEAQQAPQTPEGAGGTETAPAPEQTTEQDPAVTELIDLFSSIKKLKGKVWIAGNSLHGDMSMGVDIYVEDPADKQTIINAVQKEVPELVQPTEVFPDGQLHFHTGEPGPDEESQLVYDPAGGAEAPPEAASPAAPDMGIASEMDTGGKQVSLPPEIAGMM